MTSSAPQLGGRLTSVMAPERNLWGIGVLGLVIAGVVIRIPTLWYPLNEPAAFFPFRQTQTAIVIREYMNNGLSLHSPLSVLGPPWNTPLEFPLYQLLAAQLGLALGLADSVAARITCLIFFEVTAVLMAILARRWFGRATSLIALVLFQFLPFGYVYGSASMIEFVATASFLAAILAIDSWTRRPNPWLLILVTVLMSTGFLVKITTAVPWVLVYVAVVLTREPEQGWRHWFNIVRRRWGAVIPMVIGAAAGLGWTRYADSIKAQGFYSEFLISTNLGWWNFGTLDQRRDVDNWLMPTNWAGSIGGPILLLMILFLLALLAWPTRRLIVLSLILAFPLSVAIFFNLYVVHNYYLCAVYPALVLVIAAAICGAVRFGRKASIRVSGGLASASALGIGFLTLLPMTWAYFLAPQKSNGSRRAFELPAIATLSVLTVIPVAGPHLAVASLLMIPVMAVLLIVATRVLLTRRHYSTGTRVAVAALVVAGIAAQLWVLSADLRDAVRNYPAKVSMELTGADGLKLTGDQVKIITDNADWIKANCDTFYSLPGLDSYYVLTGLPIPGAAAPRTWWSSLSEAEQLRIIDDMENSPRPCFLRYDAMKDFWLQGNPLPTGPLLDYLTGKYTAVEQFNSVVLLTRK